MANNETLHEGLPAPTATLFPILDSRPAGLARLAA
jgi:hypothetical protein